jgi:hypothetical protein
MIMMMIMMIMIMMVAASRLPLSRKLTSASEVNDFHPHEVFVSNCVTAAGKNEGCYFGTVQHIGSRHLTKLDSLLQLTAVIMKFFHNSPSTSASLQSSKSMIVLWKTHRLTIRQAYDFN